MPGLLKISAVTLLAVLLAGCGCDEEDAGITALSGGERQHVRVQLDWFPESQHGGLYMAQAQGYFAEEGLDVELLPGGNNVVVQQAVGMGRVEFGQAATSMILTNAARGLPVKIIAACFQNAPSVLMLHDSNPVNTFEDLDGRTIMGRQGALYQAYLRQTYGINFSTVPQSFGLGQFLSDPEFIQEGFYIAEFYFIEKNGVTPKALKLSDSGFINALVLITSDAFMAENPQAVAGFTRAYLRGWREYLTGDPAPAHAAIIRANATIQREVGGDFLDFSRELIIRDKLAEGAPEYGESPGIIGAARLEKQIAQLVGLGVIESGSIKAEDVLVPVAPKR